MIEIAASGTLPRADARTLASEKLSGAWAFILLECVTFSAYFVIYMLYRMHNPETFARSQTHLSPTFGMVNTLILLTSSWQVARSVHSTRAAQYRAAQRQAVATVALGAVFIVSKLIEWSLELARGYTFGTDDFFAFYFFLTGIHVVHVLVGFVFMGAAVVKLRGAEACRETMEVAAVYWHMVDFLWVVIFTLLYVMR
ncbi:MAG: cytochrome c oxidase subunit 3 [Polyangiales bacterium]